MELDIDDTITAGERPGLESAIPDLDDTIILGDHTRHGADRQSDKRMVQPALVTPHVTAPPAATSRSYYRIELGGTNTAFDLERACVFGRDPRPPRIVHGLGPRLVGVDSPLREVSETHVEVRQLGSSVIVTDLRSTNGSIVQVPGNAAQRLRQGESVVVSAGTLVDIGDGNIIRILPRQGLE